ncbi:hypothetical protein HDU76_008514 [Blyttiomyces sp. JEL0837]|nr:hypothetical protein HDU76_008514 [Blyttiomyces sp. JEL0837]
MTVNTFILATCSILSILASSSPSTTSAYANPQAHPDPIPEPFMAGKENSGYIVDTNAASIINSNSKLPSNNLPSSLAKDTVGPIQLSSSSLSSLSYLSKSGGMGSMTTNSFLTLESILLGGGITVDVHGVSVMKSFDATTLTGTVSTACVDAITGLVLDVQDCFPNYQPGDIVVTIANLSQTQFNCMCGRQDAVKKDSLNIWGKCYLDNLDFAAAFDRLVVEMPPLCSSFAGISASVLTRVPSMTAVIFAGVVAVLFAGL